MGEQSLGRMIRRRRESLGFSQARLGELVGRSASTIRNWERGKSSPSAPGDAVALAAVLGLDEEEVVVAAGFERGDAGSRQTVEQAYASLSPEAPAAADGRRGRETGETQPTSDEEGPKEEEERPPVPSARHADVPPIRWGPISFPSTPEPAQGRRLSAVPTQSAQREEQDEERQVSRAAPPTVLEAAPTEEPSYLEDPEQRQRYRARALATAAVVVFLLIVFLWSFDRAMDALGTMWDDFVGMLEL